MSKYQKHEREVLRAIQGMGAEALIQKTAGHPRLVVTHGGCTVVTMISSSPARPDQLARNVAKEVRRKLAEKGVVL